MTPKIPHGDPLMPLSALPHAGWLNDAEQQHRFMRLRRARSDNDVTCQLYGDANRGFGITFDTGPTIQNAKSWTLYLSITRLQGRALEQAIRADLVTPDYLLRKASTLAVHPGYLQVPLPCYVRETIDFKPRDSNNDQHYRVVMQRLLRDPKSSALMWITDKDEQLVLSETVPASVSTVRHQTVQRIIKCYTDQAEEYTRKLLRQIDAASAAVFACLE